MGGLHSARVITRGVRRGLSNVRTSHSSTLHMHLYRTWRTRRQNQPSSITSLSRVKWPYFSGLKEEQERRRATIDNIEKIPLYILLMFCIPHTISTFIFCVSTSHESGSSWAVCDPYEYQQTIAHMSYKAADGSMQGYKQEFASGFGHAQGKRYKTQSHWGGRQDRQGVKWARANELSTSFRLWLARYPRHTKAYLARFN